MEVATKLAARLGSKACGDRLKLKLRLRLRLRQEIFVVDCVECFA